MIQVDQETCRSCGLCVQECPLGALTWKQKRLLLSRPVLPVELVQGLSA